MTALLRYFCALAMLASVAACAPQISAQWTINERTPVGQDWIGSNSPTGAVPSRDAIPLPHAGSTCNSKVNPAAGLFMVFHPGVGARLRLRYWSGLENPRSVALPAATRFDGILRLVRVPAIGDDEDRGMYLSPEERELLGDFLITNRLNIVTDVSVGDRALAANAIENYEPQLWNAFVRTLCVEYVKVAYPNDDHLGVWNPYTLSLKADMAALCDAVPDKNLQAGFLKVFVGGTLDPQGKCPEDAVASNPATGSLLGTDETAHQNNFASVVTGLANTQKNSNYYAGVQKLKIVAMGDVTLQLVHFGTPGTELWTLADWQASGVCVDPEKTDDLPVIYAVGLSGFYYRVKDPEAATYEVVRSVTDGYRYAVRRKASVSSSSLSISVADLRLLTPNDVTGLIWSAAGKDWTVYPSCARSQ